MHPPKRKMKKKKKNFMKTCKRSIIKSPKHDIVIIMGDLNAKIGKEKVYQQVVGKNTLHESTNANGECASEYAIANNMKIVSTCF